MTDAQSYRVATRRLQDEEDRSIGTAMRATFWFVAIVLLLLWAGVSDAAPTRATAAAAVAAHAG
ncbi:MAG TPA: hypothetical protein VFN70_14160 [Burkholderiales bacterium]|nr:hypothetical protein [Burkholderiales bacterium]